MTTVFVPGTPVPQGSTKAFAVAGRARVTAANGKKLNPWRADIHATVIQATGDTIEHPDGPVAVRLRFVMPRRKAEPKRTTPPHTRRPDLDKTSRAVIDALIGVVFTDDSQLVLLVASKRTADPGELPGVHITWKVPDEDMLR